MTQDELTTWIATVTGRGVQTLERVGYGASRATYIAELVEGDDVVARVDTGDGPMAGTELSLAREAEAYRALAGTAVRIPRLHGVAPDGSALLAARAPGTHDLAGLRRDDRVAVFDDYVDALADLHLVDAQALDLPSFRRPSDGPTHATNELDLWEGILQSRTRRPWPLTTYAIALLRRLAPTAVSRTVLCHGDVGPGNFMHDGRRVTALLDWEFSHLGDPMDDLAWWVFRGHDFSGNCGDLAAQLRRWSDRTGLPVEPRSIEYYRAVVMVRWLVSIAAPIEVGGTTMDRSVYFGLVPILSTRLPAALAALVGVDLGPPPGLPEPSPGPTSDIIEALRGDITDVIVPELRSPDAQRRGAAALIYLSHLARVDEIGPAVAAADDDELRELLGRPVDAAERDEALMAVVSDGEPAPELLRYLWRSGIRRAALWPLMWPLATASPTPVPRIHSSDEEGAA